MPEPAAAPLHTFCLLFPVLRPERQQMIMRMQAHLELKAKGAVEIEEGKRGVTLLGQRKTQYWLRGRAPADAVLGLCERAREIQVARYDEPLPRHLRALDGADPKRPEPPPVDPRQMSWV